MGAAVIGSKNEHCLLSVKLIVGRALRSGSKSGLRHAGGQPAHRLSQDAKRTHAHSYCRCVLFTLHAMTMAATCWSAPIPNLNFAPREWAHRVDTARVQHNASSPLSPNSPLTHT